LRNNYCIAHETSRNFPKMYLSKLKNCFRATTEFCFYMKPVHMFCIENKAVTYWYRIKVIDTKNFEIHINHRNSQNWHSKIFWRLCGMGSSTCQKNHRELSEKIRWSCFAVKFWQNLRRVDSGFSADSTGSLSSQQRPGVNFMNQFTYVGYNCLTKFNLLSIYLGNLIILFI
jgi:hypothetical protein